MQIAHETAGAARTRSSLQPSSFYEGGKRRKASGGSRREKADAYPHRCLKSVSVETVILRCELQRASKDEQSGLSPFETWAALRPPQG